MDYSVVHGKFMVYNIWKRQRESGKSIKILINMKLVR